METKKKILGTIAAVGFFLMAAIAATQIWHWCISTGSSQAFCLELLR